MLDLRRAFKVLALSAGIKLTVTLSMMVILKFCITYVRNKVGANNLLVKLDVFIVKSTHNIKEMFLFAILYVVCLLSVGETVNLSIHAIYGVIPQMSASNIAPAVELAIEEIDRRVDDDEYNNFSITIHPHISRCFVCLTASAIAAENYYSSDGRVAAFLGPSCSDLMRGVAELSAVWGTPVLSGLDRFNFSVGKNDSSRR